MIMTFINKVNAINRQKKVFATKPAIQAFLSAGSHVQMKGVALFELTPQETAIFGDDDKWLRLSFAVQQEREPSSAVSPEGLVEKFINPQPTKPDSVHFIYVKNSSWETGGIETLTASNENNIRVVNICFRKETDIKRVTYVKDAATTNFKVISKPQTITQMIATIDGVSTQTEIIRICSPISTQRPIGNGVIKI